MTFAADGIVEMLHYVNESYGKKLSEDAQGPYACSEKPTLGLDEIAV